MEPWVPALVVAAGSTLLTLARPGITPDHPWADRRLLVALPLVVVLVVVAAPLAGADGRSSAGLGGSGSRSPVSWRHPSWCRPSSPRGRTGLVAWSVGRWPPSSRCVGPWGPDDVVLAVDSRAANEWPQVVRGMCGGPSLSLTSRVRSDEELLRRRCRRSLRVSRSEGAASCCSLPTRRRLSWPWA